MSDQETANVITEPPEGRPHHERPVSQRYKVIPSSKASSFEVKSWPMLGEFDEETTNALGYPKDFFEQKRQKAEEQRRKALEEQAALEEQQRQEAEKQETQVPMITADELENLRAAAESEGRESGFKAGHDEGLAQGLEEGKAEGLKQGHDEGYAQGLEQGFAEGSEKGYKEGREQGLTEGESIVMEQTERFRHLADALSSPLAAIDASVGDSVAYLVAKLFKILAGRELSHDPVFIKNSIEKALSLLPEGSAGAEIMLNPDDRALVETAMGREYLEAQHWKLKDEASLAPGDVRVCGETSEILWKLDERIASLVNEFMDAAADQDLSGAGFERSHGAEVAQETAPAASQDEPSAEEPASDAPAAEDAAEVSVAAPAGPDSPAQ